MAKNGNTSNKKHGLTGKANASKGKENWEQFSVTAPAGTKERLKTKAKSLGISVADLKTQAILEKLTKLP